MQRRGLDHEHFKHFADRSTSGRQLAPATSDEIIAAAREHMSRRVRRGTQLSSPKATRDYLTLKLGSLEREVFAVIFLDLCGVKSNVKLRRTEQLFG
jgi:DNA repair protein RadC